jgi:polyphenol oxidase
MLEFKRHWNGVATLESPRLRAIGVTHGFATRMGGVSTGVFASLNLGNPSEGERDSQANLRANYAALHRALRCPLDMPRAWVKQVHGSRVELIGPEPEGEYGETVAAEVRDRYSGQVEADGMVTRAPGVLLTIRVADCVPILLASEDGRVVGAAHAGWRGVVAGVVARAVEVMREAGAEPATLTAAIGPGISAEHFAVGEDVAEAFGRAGLAEAVLPVGGARDKPHVDLQAAIRRQLERAGVTLIDGNNVCTYRDSEMFYSHRRDHGRTGRMAAVIAARG